MSPRGFLLLLSLLIGSGCASGDAVNQGLRRHSDRGRTATRAMASGALALLESPRVDAYTLGSYDVLQVEVVDLKALGEVYAQRVEIDWTGYITFPLVGRVSCAGLTVDQVRSKLVSLLGETFITSPQVAVSVAEYKSKRVAVLGPVARPGVVFLQRNTTTVVEAIAQAGGLVPDVAGMSALLVRSSGTTDLVTPMIEIDVESLTAGDLSQNFTVRPGEVLQITPAERYYVTGYVTTPGEYPLRRTTSLLEAISIAGGVITPDASPDECYVLRAGDPPIHCDLEAIASGQAEDIVLEPGDLVQVRQGFWRGLGLGFYRFIKGGIGFGYNLAGLIPPF